MRGLPFFKLPKKQNKFQWTKKAQESFEYLKKYLTTPTHPSGPGIPQNLEALHIGYKQRG
jgi:hypothetical protein